MLRIIEGQGPAPMNLYEMVNQPYRETTPNKSVDSVKGLFDLKFSRLYWAMTPEQRREKIDRVFDKFLDKQEIDPQNHEIHFLDFGNNQYGLWISGKSDLDTDALIIAEMSSPMSIQVYVDSKNRSYPGIANYFSQFKRLTLTF